MKIDAVIFDMDGTIADTEKYYNETWPKAFAACGYSDYTREDALLQRSLNHADAQKLWGSRYGADFSFEEVHQVNTKLVLDLMDKRGIEKKPGLEPLLAYLKEKNIKTAVATATKYERAIPRLEALGLAQAFDAVISVSMVKIGKPHPDVYLYACKELGVNPQNCVAIEDSPNGLKSAASAGCITLMVPDLTLPSTEDLSIIHDWAPDLEKIIPIIEKILAQ